MIEVRDLKKSYGSHQIWDGVSFRIEKGESVVIIGRSGGGKSVLLKHLVGLLEPDGGQVLKPQITSGTAPPLTLTPPAPPPLEPGISIRHQGTIMAIADKITESQIWKSVFRHPMPTDRRNRVVVMLTNFFLTLTLNEVLNSL